MIVTRRELTLQSTLYSREFNVERSVGCHLMPIIHAISRASGWTKYRSESADDAERQLNSYSLPGFLWEQVMTVEDRLEYAMSREFMCSELRHRHGIMFPGELFFCIQCEDVMPAANNIAHDHCLTRSHTGIFFNIDYLNTERERVGEMKWTRKSSGKACTDSSLDVREWLAQNQFYCSGVGWNKGEFRVCFENGDYSYPMIPRMYEIDVDYTERELKNNFSLIVSTAKSLEWI